MPGHRTAPSRHWWRRLLGSTEQRPHDLPEEWAVIDGPAPRTEVVIGPPGVFLLDHRRSRPSDVARAAGELSGRLTAALGHCVTVHGVLVEPAARTVRADQPNGVTIVTSVVLGPWLRSHPRAFDERQVHMLTRALDRGSSPTRTG